MSAVNVSLESESKQEPSEGFFQGHQAAVTGLQIHGGCLYTCSEDQRARAFSLVVSVDPAWSDLGPAAQFVDPHGS